MIKISYKSNWVYAASAIPLLFFASSNISAKEIHLQGTVTCKEKGDNYRPTCEFDSGGPEIVHQPVPANR